MDAHDDCVALVVDSNFFELFRGTHEYTLKWLEKNPDSKAKMVAVGKDLQFLSIGEYKALHG